jgi:hypothetical protein
MVYFANSQNIYFMSDLLSCTTKLDEPRVLYVLCHITGIARVDGVIYSTDPIFTSGRSRVLYMCFPYGHTKGDMLYSR